MSSGKTNTLTEPKGRHNLISVNRSRLSMPQTQLLQCLLVVPKDITLISVQPLIKRFSIFCTFAFWFFFSAIYSSFVFVKYHFQWIAKGGDIREKQRKTSMKCYLLIATEYMLFLFMSSWANADRIHQVTFVAKEQNVYYNVHNTGFKNTTWLEFK